LKLVVERKNKNKNKNLEIFTWKLKINMDSQDKLNSTLCRYILDSNILYNYYTSIFVEPISTAIPLNIWRLICTKLDEGWFQPSAFRNIAYI
jgi:hypothetical protein